ncbi:MAG: hypothetical protein ABIH41_02460 [Nanoarchaeota archaeon]
MATVDQIQRNLRALKGIVHAERLDRLDASVLYNMEDSRNMGVLECLQRDVIFVLLHDSSFREPAGRIVDEVEGKQVFPPVPFPEVQADNVVSSSPGKDVHKFLVEKYGLPKEEEFATLLVGFDN